MRPPLSATKLNEPSDLRRSLPGRSAGKTAAETGGGAFSTVGPCSFISAAGMVPSGLEDHRSVDQCGNVRAVFECLPTAGHWHPEFYAVASAPDAGQR